MLKLVPALEIPFDNVLKYYNSYNGNDKDIENVIIISAKFGKARYENALRSYSKKNINFLYYLIDTDNPNYIIGFGDIGNIDLDYHSGSFDFGSLSYGIKPDEREKKYGTKVLSLLLEKCKVLGLEEVCLSCFASNIGSKKVIEYNGGIFEYAFLFNNELALKYWISIKEKKEDKVLCKTIPSQFRGIRKNH